MAIAITFVIVPTTVVKTPAIASRLGLIDGNALPIEGLPIYPLDGILHCLLMPKGHESKAPQSPRLSIVDDLRFNDLAKLVESPLEGGIVCHPREPTDEAAVFDIRFHHRR